MTLELQRDANTKHRFESERLRHKSVKSMLDTNHIVWLDMKKQKENHLKSIKQFVLQELSSKLQLKRKIDESKKKTKKYLEEFAQNKVNLSRENYSSRVSLN